MDVSFYSTVDYCLFSSCSWYWTIVLNSNNWWDVLSWCACNYSLFRWATRHLHSPCPLLHNRKYLSVVLTCSQWLYNLGGRCALFTITTILIPIRSDVFDLYTHVAIKNLLKSITCEICNKRSHSERCKLIDDRIKTELSYCSNCSANAFAFSHIESEDTFLESINGCTRFLKH